MSAYQKKLWACQVDNHDLRCPDESVFWTFGEVKDLGNVPVIEGAGNRFYRNYLFSDAHLRVAYLAFRGHFHSPGEILYAGMGKPQRPLWRYSGSGRMKCEMFLMNGDDREFTIQVLAISQNWQKIAVLENFLCVNFEPVLNRIRHPKHQYVFDDYVECEKLWKENYEGKFGKAKKISVLLR